MGAQHTLIAPVLPVGRRISSGVKTLSMALRLDQSSFRHRYWISAEDLLSNFVHERAFTVTLSDESGSKTGVADT